MAQVEFDIVRFKNDTYPLRGVMKIDNNHIDLTESTVVMYYDEVVNNVVRNIKITAVVTNPLTGEFSVIPKKSYTEDITDVTNPVNIYPFSVDGVFDYSIVRVSGSYELDTAGLYVFYNGEYTLYDEALHLGIQRLSKFVEKMTHNTGKLYINNRVGI